MTPALPCVSALVPAWNSAGFVEATLQSLVEQDYPALEILVSVDVSPDNTLDVCKAFAARHDNIRVIAQQQRQGWVGNVNALLREAAGKYCFFAFHDDLLEPEYVSRLVGPLEADTGVSVAFSDLDVLQVDGTLEQLSFTELENISNPVERARQIIGLDCNWWVAHRGLFRKTDAEVIGGLRRHLAKEYAADWPWMVHLAIRGKYVQVPGIYCHKQIKPGSLAKSWRPSFWTWCGVGLSIAREVWRSELPVTGKLQLWLEELRLLLRRIIRKKLN